MFKCKFKNGHHKRHMFRIDWTTCSKIVYHSRLISQHQKKRGRGRGGGRYVTKLWFQGHHLWNVISFRACFNLFSNYTCLSIQVHGQDKTCQYMTWDRLHVTFNIILDRYRKSHNGKFLMTQLFHAIYNQTKTLDKKLLMNKRLRAHTSLLMKDSCKDLEH